MLSPVFSHKLRRDYFNILGNDENDTELCRHVVSAGLRTGQTGQLPRGLHKKGPPQKHTFFLNMAVSYSVCHRGLLVNVCKFHFNYAFYTEVNG